MSYAAFFERKIRYGERTVMVHSLSRSVSDVRFRATHIENGTASFDLIIFWIAKCRL